MKTQFERELNIQIPLFLITVGIVFTSILLLAIWLFNSRGLDTTTTILFVIVFLVSLSVSIVVQGLLKSVNQNKY